MSTLIYTCICYNETSYVTILTQVLIQASLDGTVSDTIGGQMPRQDKMPLDRLLLTQGCQVRMVSVATGSGKSARIPTECQNHFPALASVQAQREGRGGLVKPGGATRFVTSHDIVQAPDSTTSSTTSEENLSFTVLLMSGATQVFQGFSYDDHTSKLEACVLSWISVRQDIHPFRRHPTSGCSFLDIITCIQ